MSKKQAGDSTQNPLPTMEDADLQEGVTQKMIDMGLMLQREMDAEAKAKAATKQTRGALCDEMVNANIDRFRISSNGVIKWIELETIDKIKIVKSESHPDNFEDPGDDPNND